MALVLDANVNKSQLLNTSTVTSPSFSTTSANEVVFAYVISDAVSSGTGTLSVSGAGLSWTKRAQLVPTFGQGNLSVWSATAAGILTSQTVTATDTAINGDMSIVIQSFTGADSATPVGATASQTTAGAPANEAITTTRAGSQVIALYYDTDGDTAPTLGSNQTSIVNVTDANDLGEQAYWKQTSTTPASGTSVTMNVTAPTADNIGFLVVEILAAASTSFSPPPRRPFTPANMPLVVWRDKQRIRDYTVPGSVPVSASVAQVAATVTATGGTQTIATVRNATVAQVAATVTATGGTQTISAAISTSVAQTAATVTATGGTQTIATVNNVAITQVGATVTATGGTQVIATVNKVAIAQVAATVTASGGTQAVASVQKVAIAQVAGTVTATGGTQSIATVNNVAISQVAGTVTATGGTQVVAAFQTASVAQVAATVTATGGTQAVATVNNVSISQVAATVTASGGTQAAAGIIASTSASISQVAATVTATGGQNTVTATIIVSPTATNVITLDFSPPPVLALDVREAAIVEMFSQPDITLDLRTAPTLTINVSTSIINVDLPSDAVFTLGIQ